MGQLLTNGATLLIGVLLVLAIAYRYYSAFIAAKVLALDDTRPTPATRLNDGQNYHPTNRWVLFGHHFAAISGAGPLIGPVLAAQFGFLPGLLWILIGVCLAGAVQDFVILGLSIRRNGKSLAQIAFSEIGPGAGTAATIGILFVLVIALAGLGKAVTNALGGETVAYDPRTQFVAAAGSPIVEAGSIEHGNKYTIPAGTQIISNGATQTVTSAFELEATSKEAMPIFLVSDKDTPLGSKLVIPDGASAKQNIAGSSWGTFTIAMTIPIALFIGVYLYRIRKNRVLEASIIGGVLTLIAVYLGGKVADVHSSFHVLAPYFNVSGTKIGIAMAIYGFVASVLPVWLLLCPRDYLSSFLKIGTVSLLVIGVIIAHPHIHAPPINDAFLGGGPVVRGAIFPFLFITIMCGAVSGFHALVASGTTPKMISNEKDARMIGYGSMLIEGLVGIIALIAATALPMQSYYDINTASKDVPAYSKQIFELAQHDRMAGIDDALPDVGEHIQGRTGGAVTLAIGMAKIFNDAISNVSGVTAKSAAWLGELFKYWYHFAIMFEALFILTTIDTGTRVGRFLLQETMGKWVHPALGQTDWWFSTILSTSAISAGWFYFLNANSFRAIWAMFGVSNQMLAVMALAIASAAIAGSGKARYVWVTLIPMCVVAITTTTAAWLMLKGYFASMDPLITISFFRVGLTAACFAAIALLVRVSRDGYVWLLALPLAGMAIWIGSHAIDTKEGSDFTDPNLVNAFISAGCVVAILACSAVVVTGALISASRAGGRGKATGEPVEPAVSMPELEGA